MDDLLFARGAARILDVTPAAVRKMHNRGALPAAARIDGVRLFSRDVVTRAALARAERRQQRSEPSDGR